MAQRKLTMGKDAQISVLSNKVHPSALIRERWPNPLQGHRLNCRVKRQEIKLQQRKQQLVLIFVSPEVVDEDGTELELHTVPHWCKIIEEGHPDFFFNHPEAAETPPEEVEQVPTPATVLQIAQTGRIDELNLAELAGVVNVDDDTQPLPENIPEATNAPADDIMGEWGHNGVCERKKVDAPNRNAPTNSSSNSFFQWNG